MKTKKRYILGIHDGHNATACILHNGKILYAISEERLSRNKNQQGYPKQAINEVLELSNIAVKDLTCVAIASDFMHSANHLKEISEWYKVGFKDQQHDQKVAKDYNQEIYNLRRRERIDRVIEHLEVSPQKIRFIEHHLAHAAAAYFGSPWPLSEKTLVMTCDGAGDNLSATVNIGYKASLKRISFTDRHASLGKIYSRGTFLLGMKPWEHEYKVMGLAPYADPDGVKKSLPVFKKLLDVNTSNLTFKRLTELSMNYIYYYLRDELENHRFDWIAGAVQKFTEELLVKWIVASVKKTGIRKVACGGGVFMNVKANCVIQKSNQVESLFIFPSCGDESTALGAAYEVYYEALLNDLQPFKKDFLRQIYFGTGYNNEQINKEIKKYNLEDNCNIERLDDIHAFTGQKLAEGKIVARFFGRMEWGARALGNRSILADPTNLENVEKINDMIKMRDFWMPFAPSILYERAGDYIVDWEDGIEDSYMIMAFGSTDLARKELRAAMHPKDKTIRPQVVRKKTNPEYHQVLKSFEDCTGIGGILNTSFNLHGYPIVESPADAIEVFLNSGLKSLAIGNYFVEKGS